MYPVRTFLPLLLAVACASGPEGSLRSTAAGAAPPPDARPRRFITTVEKDGCKIEVDFPKVSAVGSRVRVCTRITNIGNTPVLMSRARNKPLPFDLELKAGGNAVPLTRYGVKKIAPTELRDQLQLLDGSVRQWTLEPGETQDLDLPNLALYYDLTVPGEYDLSISKFIIIGEGPTAKDVRLRAKAIRLTIAAP